MWKYNSLWRIQLIILWQSGASDYEPIVEVTWCDKFGNLILIDGNECWGSAVFWVNHVCNIKYGSVDDHLEIESGFNQQ
jgi:hypothetical protein